MSTIEDPRSSEGYKPRFEIWMNVFLHQAVKNTINSLTSLEIETRNIPGAGIMTSTAHIPLDRLVWNVKILDALIIDEWKIADKTADFEAMTKGIDKNEEPDKYFHQIIQLLQKRRMLRFRQPRSMGARREET